MTGCRNGSLQPERIIMSEILLETHALTKQFRRHKAVSEIDMHIKRGAVYGFIG